MGFELVLSLLGLGCAPQSTDTANDYDGIEGNLAPSLDVQFVGDNYTHQADGRDVVYYQSLDQFCDGQMQLDLVVDDPDGDSVLPKAYVGYFSDESGWYGYGNGLDGLDQSDTLNVGSSLGQAVSISGNISPTDDPAVYEFNYMPAQDELVDNNSWSFDLFFVATDGRKVSTPEMWQYSIAEYTSAICGE